MATLGFNVAPSLPLQVRFCIEFSNTRKSKLEHFNYRLAATHIEKWQLYIFIIKFCLLKSITFEVYDG